MNPAPEAPQAPESELLLIRRQKLEQLQAQGVAAFGQRFEVSHDPGKLKAEFEEGLEVRVAGRVMSRRVMGKATFFDVADISGRIQC
jgi:lysyl-tRNA synthetase class 2